MPHLIVKVERQQGQNVQTIHGTVIDVAGSGVVLMGPSGSGKSDLALRLIDRGATLVADDQFYTRPSRRGLVAFAPDNLYGLFEVRGLGVQSISAIKTTILQLVVNIVAESDVPRIPEPVLSEINGEKIHAIMLNAFENSAPIKIELAVGDVTRIGKVGKSDG